MIKKISYQYIPSLVFFLLVMALPQRVAAQPETFAEVIGEILSILGVVFPLLSVAAVALFFWGLAKYVFQAGNEGAVQQGKFMMTWGILAIFVLFSIWGILAFFYGEFGFTEGFGTFLLPTG
ncbi:MAG: hypothetical protein WD049_03715 [Candidatus Paceibacterota bacterium]